MRSFLKIGSLIIVLFCIGAVGYGAWQLKGIEQGVQLKQSQLLTITPGESARSVMQRLMPSSGEPFWQALWLMLHPELAKVQAGTFELEAGWGIRQIFDWLSHGQAKRFRLTFVEGTDYRNWRALLQKSPYLQQRLAKMPQGAVIKALGASHSDLEGLLLPDTYLYTDRDSDLTLIKRAYQHMQQFLDEQWSSRAPNLPVKTPYQALILASMIEKETGDASERALIASVFVNRLRKGIRLQSDPTVIYGLGDRYQGRLHKRDLRDPSPYNTYMHAGLPPTPIAMPGRASIVAALHPDDSRYFYFVAKGDGSHYFSKSLAEHNRAVRRYILGKP